MSQILIQDVDIFAAKYYILQMTKLKRYTALKQKQQYYFKFE